MLEYLITSKTRRSLLELLWRDRQSGTASELARRANCAFAGAYNELQAMEDAELAISQWDGKTKVYLANANHPMGKLLVQILKTPIGQKVAKKSNRSDLEKLAYLGLPVSGPRRPPKAVDRLEDLVVSGAKAARDNPTTARAFPVLLWKLRGKLDFKLVRELSRKRGQQQNVGFLMELAGQLGKDTYLVAAAHKMQDRRRCKQRYYFDLDSDYAKKLADLRTPELARNWGWLMNMGYDAFESTFRKFNDGLASG